MHKSITFLLPSRASKGPSGGFKIVYEYANRLAKDGISVHIVYPVVLNYEQLSLKLKFRAILRYFVWKLDGISCRSWFKLHPSINEHLSWSLDQRYVPETDYYVATAVKTAYYLADYNVSKNKCFYLIQGYEAWGVSEDFVNNSYKLGLQNIVISDWLKEKVEIAGSRCVVIKNAFDFDYFKLTEPIQSNKRCCISMLYHSDKIKGCEYGITAMRLLHESFPEIKFILFGKPKRPSDLPSWIKYYHCPDKYTHNKIYNDSIIYLAPSIQEGWGLTVGEAMICGAAIVCTDTLGFREMVQNGSNGIMVPSADSTALANAATDLIRNPKKRIRIASKGNSDIKKFDWEKSFQLFKSMLNTDQ